jgi:hypothetical protein
MERNSGRVRTRRCDQLAALEMCQGTLDRASRKPGSSSNCLMRHADRPVRLLTGMPIEIDENHE